MATYPSLDPADVWGGQLRAWDFTAHNPDGTLKPLLNAKGQLLGSAGAADVAVPAGTAGQVLVADPAQSAGLRWDNRPLGIPFVAGYRVGISSSLGYRTSNGPITITANTLWATPLLIPERMTATSAVIFIATASASGSVRIGLYTLSLTPSLVADLGVVATTAAGFKQLSPFSAPLPAGWYLMAVLPDQDYGHSAFGCALGLSLAGDLNRALFKATQAYGPLPASPTLTDTTIASVSLQMGLG